MRSLMYRAFVKAKKEGRLCERCGWLVTVKDWKKGNRLCFNCRDAETGMKNPYPHINYGSWRDEPVDKTGEML